MVHFDIERATRNAVRMRVPLTFRNSRPGTIRLACVATGIEVVNSRVGFRAEILIEPTRVLAAETTLAIGGQEFALIIVEVFSFDEQRVGAEDGRLERPIASV